MAAGTVGDLVFARSTIHIMFMLLLTIVFALLLLKICEALDAAADCLLLLACCCLPAAAALMLLFSIL